MQREKLYNLHKTTYFIIAPFVFKVDIVLGDQSFITAKTGRTKFSFFKNNCNELNYENCRATHAASHGVLCFLLTKCIR